MIAKSSIRDAAVQPGPPATPEAEPGRLGEHLRRSEPYRRATTVFVSPAVLLRQVRLNVLADGKHLVMPAAQLREGFYRLKPFTVPFKHLRQAVTPAGLSRFGTRLKAADLGQLSVDLVISEALAVDRLGFMVGDGHGFLDLSMAILAAHGAVSESTRIVCAPLDQQQLADLLAREPWDVRAQAVLSASGLAMVENLERGMPLSILWDRLTLDRIKRITPLWQLYQLAHPLPTASPARN